MKNIKSTQFTEVKNGKVKASTYVLLRFSHPTALYVTQFGDTTLHAISAEHEVKSGEPFEVSWQPEEGLKAFLYTPLAQHYKTQGEVFTNMDRKPHESGVVYEVRKAMRQQALAHQRQRNEMTAHARALRQTFQTGKPAPEPIPVTPDPEEPKPVDKTE